MVLHLSRYHRRFGLPLSGFSSALLGRRRDPRVDGEGEPGHERAGGLQSGVVAQKVRCLQTSKSLTIMPRVLTVESPGDGRQMNH